MALFFIAVSTTLAAAEFEVKITSYPPRAIVGVPVPVVAEVRNVSGAPVVVARGYTGLSVMFQVRRADGKPRKGWMPGPTAQPSLTYRLETIPASWTTTYADDLRCDDIPGEWVVQAVFSSRGPYPFYEGGKITEYLKAWSGEVRSEEVHIQFEKAAGLDAEAYMSLKNCPMCDPAKLLKDFPTSTYAAYNIYQRSGAEGLARSESAKVADALTSGMGLMGEMWVPVPTGGDKNGLAPLSGQAAVEWRQKWFGIVLKSHPDIWFADALRLKLAVDQVALKNYQGGQADLEALAKNEKSPMACNAKALLSLLKERGLMKS